MGGDFFNDLDAKGALIAEDQHRGYCLDILRNMLSISRMKECIPDQMTANSIGCVIGDGFGTAAAALLMASYAKAIVLINLTKTLYADLWYLRRSLGLKEFEEKVVLITDGSEYFPKDGEVIAIQAKDQMLMRNFEIDYVLNIVSMQEMNMTTIEEYFNSMRYIARRKDI